MLGGGEHRVEQQLAVLAARVALAGERVSQLLPPSIEYCTLVIALPLGIWLFRPLRERATASIAAVDERRRQDREQLQARLRGEDPKS